MRDSQSDYEGEVLACGIAGSLILFNGSVWHGHTANVSSESRRSIQGYFVRRDANSGIDWSPRMQPETLARICPRHNARPFSTQTVSAVSFPIWSATRSPVFSRSNPIFQFGTRTTALRSENKQFALKRGTRPEEGAFFVGGRDRGRGKNTGCCFGPASKDLFGRIRSSQSEVRRSDREATVQTVDYA